MIWPVRLVEEQINEKIGMAYHSKLSGSLSDNWYKDEVKLSYPTPTYLSSTPHLPTCYMSYSCMLEVNREKEKSHRDSRSSICIWQQCHLV
jgi:hypothetical protein